MKKVIIILTLFVACSKKNDPTPKINKIEKPDTTITNPKEPYIKTITVSGLFIGTTSFENNYVTTVYNDTIKIINIKDSLIVSGKLIGKSFKFSKSKDRLKTVADNPRYVGSIVIQETNLSYPDVVSADSTNMIYYINSDIIYFSKPELISTKKQPNGQKIIYTSNLTRK